MALHLFVRIRDTEMHSGGCWCACVDGEELDFEGPGEFFWKETENPDG